MEKVFVIAGGEWQKPLVRRVRELGYETINSNLYPDSPAFQYADHSEITDVKDLERNLAIGRKYHVDAVLTDESDIAVPTVAYVSETLELPGIGREMASLFTNKYKMCHFAMTHGLKVPEHACCRSGQEAAAFVKDLFEKKICEKAIMKPLDSQSSRGVYILKRPEDAELFYELSASYSSDRSSVIVIIPWLFPRRNTIPTTPILPRSCFSPMRTPGMTTSVCGARMTTLWIWRGFPSV